MTYDAPGRLIEQVDAHGLRTTSTWDAAGHRTLVKQSDGGRVSFVYDAADRLASKYNFKADNTIISGHAYDYDRADNRTGQLEATGRRTTWSYDDAYQLVNENRSSVAGGFNNTFTYDPVGNRPVKNASGELTTSTFDAANQLQTSLAAAGATTFTFDATGNQAIEQAPTGTTTTTWDYENQPMLVTKPDGSLVTTVYNAEMRRLRKRS